MAPHVHGNDVVVLREQRRHHIPVGQRPTESVDEDYAVPTTTEVADSKLNTRASSGLDEFGQAGLSDLLSSSLLLVFAFTGKMATVTDRGGQDQR
jgi:hypothetical protein